MNPGESPVGHDAVSLGNQVVNFNVTLPHCALKHLDMLSEPGETGSPAVSFCAVVQHVRVRYFLQHMDVSLLDNF